MRRTVAIGLMTLALAGCETTDKPPTTMKNLPEFGRHMDCLAAQARQYARVEGSPLELGIIGASACGATRVALHQAVMRAEGRTFADAYTETGRREEPKMIAADIIRLRGK